MLTCPRCSYNLQGLPAAYTCPECGLEYDPNCRVTSIEPSESLTTQVALGVLLLAGLLWGMHVTGFDKRDVYLIALVLLSLSFTALRRSHTNFRSLVIITNHQGMRFENLGPQPREFGWTEIGSIQCTWPRRRLELLSPQGRTLLNCPPQVLGGRRQARWIAMHLEQQRQRYCESA